MIYLLQVIFPYVVLFYIIDCFVNVKRFQVIFYSHFGKKYNIRKKGIRFIGISPFCRLFNATNFPFFFADSGIYLWNKAGFEENDLYCKHCFDSIPYEEIESIKCDGNLVVMNGSRKLHLNSSHHAEYLKNKIYEVKKKSGKHRKKLIDEIIERPEPANQIMAKHQFMFLMIQSLGTMLFIQIFIFLPGFLYLGFPLKLHMLIWIIAACYVLVAGFSFYSHRKICKSCGKNLLFLFSMIFSPVSAIHTLHLITRDIALDLDYAIPASYLLSPEAFKKYLKKEIKRIHFSKEMDHGRSLASFLEKKEHQYFSLLEKAGLKQDDIFKPPLRNDPVAHNYCPFCGAEYMDGIKKCTDCSIDLKEYEGSP